MVLRWFSLLKAGKSLNYTVLLCSAENGQHNPGTDRVWWIFNSAQVFFYKYFSCFIIHKYKQVLLFIYLYIMLEVNLCSPSWNMVVLASCWELHYLFFLCTMLPNARLNNALWEVITTKPWYFCRTLWYESLERLISNLKPPALLYTFLA